MFTRTVYALAPTQDYLSSQIYQVNGEQAQPLFSTRGWATRLFPAALRKVERTQRSQAAPVMGRIQPKPSNGRRRV
jgi:hypothetical protein